MGWFVGWVVRRKAMRDNLRCRSDRLASSLSRRGLLSAVVLGGIHSRRSGFGGPGGALVVVAQCLRHDGGRHWTLTSGSLFETI